MTSVLWSSLGRMEYEAALQVQEERASALLEGKDDVQTVFAVEHPPTITLGRSATFSHIVAPPARLEQIGMAIHEVDRGGDVTYHGPGQAVLYPILHLHAWRNDVGHYVRLLEQTAIEALAEVGIESTRLDGYPGVWVEGAKVCAIGARVRRRPDGEFVTSHGMALNVHTDLSHFDTIVPCGISDKTVTSVEGLLGQPALLPEWFDRLRGAFSRVFKVEVAEREHLS